MMIRIGTCSWKYDSWRGLVYPESGKLNYLKEYSQKFNTVEIDQWFWSLFRRDSIKLPSQTTVREYDKAVDKNFRFTIKVPNSITLTHFYSPQNTIGKKIPEKNPFFLSTEIFERFIESIGPIRQKTGALMFQFEYLNKNKMNSLKEFIEQLDTFFNSVNCDIPMSIELRNPNFLKEGYFEFLNGRGIYNVFMQGYYMPDIVPLYQSVKKHIRDLTIIRLIGPDRKKIEKMTGNKWDRIILPKDGEITNIADILKDLEARGIKVYLNINNHYEGSAPLTIVKIKEVLNIK